MAKATTVIVLEGGLVKEVHSTVEDNEFIVLDIDEQSDQVVVTSPAQLAGYVESARIDELINDITDEAHE